MSTATISESKDIQKLQFVRLKIPRLIPGILIENVKGRTFTPEQFYKYQESQIDNPFNYLYVLVDEDKKIHGYLWVEVNVLDRSMFVNTFSVDKQYWGKGKAIPRVIQFLSELKEKTKSPRCYWISTNEKFFVKHGFKKSKNVLMEYN
jgi:N-acetylglutamate synthase-like GNAT family acetyltransferase